QRSVSCRISATRLAPGSTGRERRSSWVLRPPRANQGEVLLPPRLPFEGGGGGRDADPRLGAPRPDVRHGTEPRSIVDRPGLEHGELGGARRAEQAGLAPGARTWAPAAALPRD